MTETTRDTVSARQLPLDPGGEVEILLTSSNLRLRGTDGDVVAVRTPGDEPLDDEIEIDANPGRIRIRERESGFRVGGLRIRGHRSADLDIDLPRGVALSVRTLSGDIEATGIAGDGRWATASGDLRLDLDGGTVAVESMSGDATLRSSAALSLTARSVSGDLDLTAPRFDRLAASTTSGDVRIDAALGAGPDHAISSVSGDVELATASPVRVDTQTITGDVRANGTHAGHGGPGRRTLVVGDGSVHVVVRTTSGDFHLRAGQVTAAATGVVIPVPAPAPVAPPAPVRPPAPVEPAAPVEVVAEAEAAPNLVRRTAPTAEPAQAQADPVAEAEAAPGAAPLGTPGPTDRREEARLEILRALERGELDIESASHRLEILEQAGPRYFRGWC